MSHLNHIVLVRDRGSVMMCQLHVRRVFEAGLEIFGALDQVHLVLVLVENDGPRVVLSPA